MNSLDTINQLKAQIARETVFCADLAYLKPTIHAWWQNKGMSYASQHLAKIALTSIIMYQLKPSDSELLSSLGTAKSGIAAVCFTNIFDIDDTKLSLLVHEAFSDLFHLNDIKYAYESHKKIYIKAGGENYSEWGNGSGIINPHSDDLYEETNTDLLSLTVCRDTTHTATRCYFPRDVFKNFSDDEFAQLLGTQAIFVYVGCYVSEANGRTDFTASKG